MKLYVTFTSPYARLARIMVLEKGLEQRVEIIPAATRTENSPYYAINPSGRVPYLLTDDGVGLEDSELICAYLDHLDGAPAFEPPEGDAIWEFRRLETRARSMLDGLAVWGRELYRPEDERSPTTLAHEQARSLRMADFWEGEISHALMQGPFNRIQMTLAAALAYERSIEAFDWRPGRPQLAAWADRIAARPSLAATLAPLRR